MSDERNWDEVDAAQDFVHMMVPSADDKTNLMWFGWALHDAFIAGAAWQRERDKATRGNHR